MFYLALVSVYYDVAAFLAVNFSLGLQQVFFKLNPTSSFTKKGLLPCEELAEAIAWLLYCKLAVISEKDIIGFL